MLDRLGHKPIPEAPSNEAFGLSLCFGSVRRPEDSKEGESIRPIGLPIVEYLERPSTLNVGTFIFMHTPDTALIMTADTISGYMQRLLDGVESSSKLPTRWTAIHLKPPWPVPKENFGR